MKRYIAFAAAFVVSAAAVMAQAPDQASASSGQQAVTVTGCLQSGSTGAAAASGGEFVLANPVMGTSAASSSAAKPPSATPPAATPPTTTPPTTTPPTTTPPQTTPPPTTPPPTSTPPAATPSAPVGTSGTAKAPSIRLTGGESESLQQYVNQRVEIQGAFQNEGGAGAAAAGRTLKITSVRPVPGNCSGGDK